MAAYYDTGKKSRIFLLITSILVLINGLISYESYRNKTSFSAIEGKFSFVSKTEDEMIFKDMDKNILKVEIEDKSSNDVSFASKYKVHYKDEVIQVDSSNYKNEGFQVVQRDSSRYIEGFRDSEYGKVYELEIPEEGLANDVGIVYGIEKVYDNVEENISLKMFFLFTFATVVGCILIVFPGFIINSEVVTGIIALIGLVITLGVFFYNIIHAFIL